eukprot:TRINITY_DN92465_c0_g1_i1.p1 TRINITY_DN92465_c0_g1~~TRINITY_DN92465_c0_g1_i1.p1  ORF type:complete len:278 (+),score=44.22 TRINITY_DN92465_c0_g1_i1:50-883(+)
MAVGRAGAVAAARQRQIKARASQEGRGHQHRHEHAAARAGCRIGFEPLAPVAVPAFLQAFGYVTQDGATWCTVPASTILRMEVDGHEEIDGHTWYSMSCELRDSIEARTSWKTRRRLASLREDLHDRVKEHLGKDYAEHFVKTPFAIKGGLPGTTARLGAWFQTLAELVNDGRASPTVVALLLQYLEAPMTLSAAPTMDAPAAGKAAEEGGPACKHDPHTKAEERGIACKENAPPKAVPPPTDKTAEVNLRKAVLPSTGKAAEAFLESNDIQISFVS